MQSQFKSVDSWQERIYIALHLALKVAFTALTNTEVNKYECEPLSIISEKEDAV